MAYSGFYYLTYLRYQYRSDSADHLLRAHPSPADEL